SGARKRFGVAVVQISRCPYLVLMLPSGDPQHAAAVRYEAARCTDRPMQLRPYQQVRGRGTATQGAPGVLGHADLGSASTAGEPGACASSGGTASPAGHEIRTTLPLIS